ncbi:potassium channel [Moniliophthora roreri MCA 2997]|uniref:Potassium channel n=2 Tax=Moniliophthora roreri TaxID=221103 RepID=V2X7C6_MONRO|nr:potassium channel [Moniliophthora roreri MCA 2997]KAI3603038.1 potassium channel [Moniliophthora roreri]
MNDPGLEEPIQKSANHVANTLEKESSKSKGAQELRKHDAETENDIEELHAESLRPTRWWLCSTVFPLIAGTLGPLANLFSVCALVQTWRIGSNGERIADPAWLIAPNIASLVFAVAANILLLLNFARRVPYLIAQPLIITFWFFSSISLVIILALAHHLLYKPERGSVTLSESYYYGLLSAILYAIISVLLTVNYFFAHPYTSFQAYQPSFDILTPSQRTLMLQTTSFTFHLALGAGVFARIEGWSFVDGVYWADYTLLTIGLGADFPLMTATARGVLIPWAVSGIIIVGLVVGSVRGLVLERGNRRVGKRAMAKSLAAWRAQATETNGDIHVDQQEFEALRAIQERATATRKYVSLGFAMLIFLIVWFGGALVFWYTEEAQAWSYPTCLYFTYVVLLTIGYGDFYPQSTAGKPFFVLWSLLAVPTMTILISNMGGTIVDWVQVGTLWLGRMTVLPERVATGRGSDVEKEMSISAQSYGDNEPLSVKLIAEIRRVSKDIGAKPPRKYEWSEWTKWMRLCSESDTERIKRNEGVVGWEPWDKDGPLFTGGTEAEWVLEKLCVKLEEVLRTGSCGG